jgi:hypothetical protein
MGTGLNTLRTVARTLGVVAFCYALLVQAALAPALRAAHGPMLAGLAESGLCLVDPSTADDSGTPSSPGHQNADCCLPASRADMAGPALQPGAPVEVPRAPTVVAAVVRPAQESRAGPSLAILAHPVRGPPSRLV